MALHEIAIALVVLRGQAVILVQVHALDLGKGELPLAVPGHQLLIGADGGGAGGKAQHAVGLQQDLGGNDMGGLTAHGGIVRALVNSHTVLLF